MTLTGAQILVETLKEQGVSTVFGYPGGTALDIFDALGSSDIRVILPAHEQGGVHAADGFSRAGGCTGVVIATSGPGATNLVTGIANAYMDSIPLVAITANVSISQIGRDSFQEVDITGVTMPVTKHNYIVQDIPKLAQTVKEAFVIANSGRPGPVLVDIPKDITMQIYHYESVGRFTPRGVKPPPEGRISQASDMLSKSVRPLIFCGGGVICANAAQQLASFAEKTGIPVAASLMGLTALPSEHSLMLGMIGMHGTPAANYAGERCDLLICIGTRFSDRVAGDRNRFAPNAKLIHIDIDDSEFDKNVICDLHITGDAKDILEALMPHVTDISDSAWLDEITAFKSAHPMPEPADSGKTNPQGILNAVAELENAVIVTDVGQHQMWTAQYYRFTKPRSLITSGGLGTMGFGLGAAVGAKAAAPERPVVLITGDGSFHMNLAELSTSVSEGLPVVVIVMNNGVLGMVRQWQRMFYDSRFNSSTTNRPTDFAKLSEAFGGLGFKCDTMDGFREAFKQAVDSGRTAVIDCAIDPDELVLPMIPPGKSVKDILYCD